MAKGAAAMLWLCAVCCGVQTAGVQAQRAVGRTVVAELPTTGQEPPPVVYSSAVRLEYPAYSLVVVYGGMGINATHYQFVASYNYQLAVLSGGRDQPGGVPPRYFGVWLPEQTAEGVEAPASILHSSVAHAGGAISFGGCQVPTSRSDPLVVIGPFVAEARVSRALYLWTPQGPFGRWQNLTQEVLDKNAGVYPSARAGHVSLAYNGSAFVFGGCSQVDLTRFLFPAVANVVVGDVIGPVCVGEVLADVWVLSADLLWTRLAQTTAQSSAPSLWLQGACLIAAHGLAIFAGGAGPNGTPHMSSAAAGFSFKDRTWVPLPASPVQPQAPVAMFCIGDHATVVGGNVALQSLVGAALNTVSRTWIGASLHDETAPVPPLQPIASIGAGFSSVVVARDTVLLLGLFVQGDLVKTQAVTRPRLTVALSAPPNTPPRLIADLVSESNSVTPRRRFGAAMARIGPLLVLFGGAGIDSTFLGVQTFHSTWLLSTSFVPNRLSWLALPPNSPHPPARHGHSLTALPSSFGAAILYGGSSDVVECMADVWVLLTLNYDQTFWHQRNSSTISPPGRFRHTAVEHNGKVIVFGGAVCDDRSGAIYVLPSNDTWVLDPQVVAWTRVAQDRPPPARRGHSASIAGGGMLVYGGLDMETVLQDLWRLDLATLRWAEVQATNAPGPLFDHCSLSIGRRAIAVVGGTAEAVNVPGTARPLSDRGNSVVWTYSAGEGWRASGSYKPVQGLACTANYTDNGGLAFGGLAGSLAQVSETRRNLAVDALSRVSLACGPGTQSPDFVAMACRPCPAGQYVAAARDRCLPCPGDSWTGDGRPAEGQAACSVCRPGFCNHNGRCSLNLLSFAPTCACAPGYLASDRCLVPWVPVGGTLAGLAVLVLALLALRRLKTRIRRHEQFEMLQEQLLEQTKGEVQRLTKAWEIPYQDLRLLRRVGGGGFGDVWCAEWNDRTVAVKMVRASLLELDGEATAEFDKEIDLLRATRHKNVVLFYGAGTNESGAPYLVQEYAERGSLDAILAANTAGWARRLGFARDAALGMRFLHGHREFGPDEPPLVHRDLKSQNLLVFHSWTVKVADFGTSRLISELRGAAAGDGLASAGIALQHMTSAVGTLCWAAPELLKAEPYNHLVDVYSFGIVLWEILTQGSPYETARSQFDVRRMVEAGERPAVPEGVVEALDQGGVYADLMQRCWDADPARRPSFAQAVAELEALVDPQPAG